MRQTRLLFVSALLLGGAGTSRLRAQTSAPAPQQPAAKRFPYPGETQTPATPQAPAAPQGTPAQGLPGAPQPSASPAGTQSVPASPNSQPASKRFPYPGETDSSTPGAAPNAPATAPGTAGRTPLQDAGSSGQSSSSSSSSNAGGGAEDGSSSSSSSRDHGNKTDDPDANDPAAIPRRERHRPPPGPRETPSEREQNDVQVSTFYFNDGNYRGSYDRAHEAVSLDNDDPAAQLALGNAARKLGKLDEAERAYRHCLELDPVPKLRKPAEKALREMTGN